MSNGDNVALSLLTNCQSAFQLKELLSLSCFLTLGLQDTRLVQVQNKALVAKVMWLVLG